MNFDSLRAHTIMHLGNQYPGILAFLIKSTERTGKAYNIPKTHDGSPMSIFPLDNLYNQRSSVNPTSKKSNTNAPPKMMA